MDVIHSTLRSDVRALSAQVSGERPSPGSDCLRVLRTAPAQPEAAPRPVVARPGFVFFAAVLLIGANLRAVFSSLPPLLDDVRADLGLSAAAAGLLTTAPLVCFGLLAPVAPSLVRRVSIERLLAACAAITAVGCALRGVGGTAGLFAGTIVAGAAVAVGQSALPTLLGARFPRASGALTGAFSMALTLGAAAAAGAAVPLMELLDDSWRAALAIFAVPAALAALVWLTPLVGGLTVVARTRPFGMRNLARSWSLAAYFGLQSMAFYVALTWIPSILEDEGYSTAAAGWLQALGNLLQLAPALLVPVIAARLHHQRLLVVVLALITAAGYAGLLAAPGVAALWIAISGIGQGGTLGLALYLPILRGAGPAAVAALTALALSAGYLLCAIGPPLVGLAHDLSGGWTLPLVLLVAISLSEIVPGWLAARPWTIGAHDRV
jgi:CP family cyanate transporter-like MFS transporter